MAGGGSFLTGLGTEPKAPSDGLSIGLQPESPIKPEPEPELEPEPAAVGVVELELDFLNDLKKASVLMPSFCRMVSFSELD